MKYPIPRWTNPLPVMSGLSSKTSCAVAGEAHERAKLERVCRYMARPPIAEQRLSVDNVYPGALTFLTKEPTPNWRAAGRAPSDGLKAASNEELFDGWIMIKRTADGRKGCSLSVSVTRKI